MREEGKCKRYWRRERVDVIRRVVESSRGYKKRSGIDKRREEK